MLCVLIWWIGDMLRIRSAMKYIYEYALILIFGGHINNLIFKIPISDSIVATFPLKYKL